MKKIKAGVYVVKTQEDYNYFMEELEEAGYTWRSGSRPTEFNMWEDYKGDTHVYVPESISKGIVYGDNTIYTGYVKADYREYVRPTHPEIKSGYLLVLTDTGTNKQINVTVLDNNLGKLGVCSDGLWFNLDEFGDTLQYKMFKVDAVYGRTNNQGLLSNSTTYRKLLWKREEEKLNIKDFIKVGYLVETRGDGYHVAIPSSNGDIVLVNKAGFSRILDETYIPMFDIVAIYGLAEGYGRGMFSTHGRKVVWERPHAGKDD